jgi:hypothetical protein
MHITGYHREEGYKQGLKDGKRTGGRITRKYIIRMFNSETKNLSVQESVDYKIGWQDGFSDAVNEKLRNAAKKMVFS